MSQRVRNYCVCSSCLARSCDLYFSENRSVVGGKKKGSIKPFKSPTLEEVERKFWTFYLQKLKHERRKKRVRAPYNEPTELGEELEVVRDITASEVFLESPTNADGHRQIMNVDSKNFWNFVYQQVWNGRIRVCEGELMYKITETLKTLVNRKKIANFSVTRMFTARGAEQGNNAIRMKQVTMYFDT